MAAVIDQFEAEPSSSEIESLIGAGEDFLGLPFQDDNLLLDILLASWSAIERRIPDRYISRQFEMVIRVDYENELIRLPFQPVTITEAQRFDAATGDYGANEAPIVGGPTPGSIVLPRPAIWRVAGTAGPAEPQAPPPVVILAIRRLTAASFQNRGDVPGEVDLVWTGALEPIKHMIRV